MSVNLLTTLYVLMRVVLPIFNSLFSTLELIKIGSNFLSIFSNPFYAFSISEPRYVISWNVCFIQFSAKMPSPKEYSNLQFPNTVIICNTYHVSALHQLLCGDTLNFFVKIVANAMTHISERPYSKLWMYLTVVGDLGILCQK